MNYTKYEPYDIKNPNRFNVPYYPNYKTIDTRNVFEYDRLDEPIRYTPFCDDVPMGDVMEKTFQKKCPKKAKNVFFYPPNAPQFFGPNGEPQQNYLIALGHKGFTCPNTQFYNTTFNMADDKRQSDILSSACCEVDKPQASPGFSQKTRFYKEDPECFFKNNQLQSSFNNYAQTEPLRKTHKYVSSYDQNINRVSCEDMPCTYSHKHSTAL